MRQVKCCRLQSVETFLEGSEADSDARTGVVYRMADLASAWLRGAKQAPGKAPQDR
jgi:hypothetical protein